MNNIIFLIVISLSLPGKLLASYPEEYINHYKAEIQKKLPVNLTHIPKGSMVTLRWAGDLISIYHKTDDEIKELNISNDSLADPKGKFNSEFFNKSILSNLAKIQTQVRMYAYKKIDNKKYRTLLDDYFIFSKSSPATGCEVILKEPILYNSDKRKIFYDPCSQTAYDAAGRVFKSKINNPAVREKIAKYNLLLSPYFVESNKKIVLGFKETNYTLPKLTFNLNKLYENKNPTQLLMTALSFNDEVMVKKALKMGARADYFAVGQGSPIDYAIYGSSTKIVKMLIRLGAKPTHSSRQLAKNFNRKDILELLDKY